MGDTKEDVVRYYEDFKTAGALVDAILLLEGVSLVEGSEEDEIRGSALYYLSEQFDDLDVKACDVVSYAYLRGKQAGRSCRKTKVL